MMTGIDPCLAVFLGDQPVARLRQHDDQLHWDYHPQWQQQGYAISPHLPLDAPIAPLNVQRFVRNLLPEGTGLDELLQRFQLGRQNTFGLIRAIGADTAGALALLPEGQIPASSPAFRPVEEDELAGRLSQRQFNGLAVWDERPRLSVAGVQDKLNLLLDPELGMGFGEGSLCSTHILKFERPELPHLVLNEFVSMHALDTVQPAHRQCRRTRQEHQLLCRTARHDRDAFL